MKDFSVHCALVDDQRVQHFLLLLHILCIFAYLEKNTGRAKWTHVEGSHMPSMPKQTRLQQGKVMSV